MSEQVPAPATDGFAQTLDAMLRPEPWCVEQISFSPGFSGAGVFEMAGWALPPEGRHERVTFTVNKAEFDEVEYPLPRADLQRVFWYKPGADRAAFRCRTTMTKELLFREGFATLQCVYRATGEPICADHNYYYPDDQGLPALPDGPRRQRVSGDDRAETFRLEGYTIFVKLDRALRRIAKRSLGEFRRILDWGCGCGRLTRYLGRLPTTVTGVDIDADNVSWCRRHLPFGDFHLVGLHPPTELEPSSFDLLIGISVFTHLRERDQLDWLAELSRVAAPGATLLMTLLGEGGVCRSPWTAALLEEWRHTGFVAFEDAHDLEGHIPEDRYYVTAYMTRERVLSSWSRFFTVKEIIPACIGSYQDLVVMRKAR